MLVEHRRFVEQCLALRHLATPVDGERLVQRSSRSGRRSAMTLWTVIELTIDDKPARLRAPQAQESDDVATVNMEILAFRRRIAAPLPVLLRPIW